MKLYIKQKVFSFHDRFTVKDEAGNDRFYVEGEIFTLGKKLHILNPHGENLLSIQQRLFTFMPKYDLIRRDETVATIIKEFTFLKPRYVIDGIPFTVEGDFFDHTYEILRDESPIASIYKEWFSWGDSYVVDVFNSDVDELILLAIAITIDCVIAAQND